MVAPTVRRHQPAVLVFLIGLLLVAVVMFLPNGILGGLARFFPPKN